MTRFLIFAVWFFLSACAHNDPRYEPSKAYVVDVCMERDNPGKCIREYRADARRAADEFYCDDHPEDRKRCGGDYPDTPCPNGSYYIEDRPGSPPDGPPRCDGEG